LQEEAVFGARRVLGFVQDRFLHDLPNFPNCGKSCIWRS
jgi:hypothetical protein